MSGKHSEDGLQMKDHEIVAGIEWGNRRLDLLRELASSLLMAQAAVVRSDLSGIDTQTERQRQLCNALQQLGNSAFRVSDAASVAESRKQHPGPRLPAFDLANGVQQRCQVLAQELRQAEMQVSQLNKVYGGLLKRALRTLQIFIRLLANSGNPYTRPECAATGASLGLETSHV